MNFFEHQDKARRQTRLLVALFSLAVFGIILAVNALVLTMFGMEYLKSGCINRTVVGGKRPVNCGDHADYRVGDCTGQYLPGPCSCAAEVVRLPVSSAEALVEPSTIPIRCGVVCAMWSRKWPSLRAFRCPKSTYWSRSRASMPLPPVSRPRTRPWPVTRGTLENLSRDESPGCDRPRVQSYLQR